jgi:hypothetical protein
METDVEQSTGENGSLADGEQARQDPQAVESTKTAETSACGDLGRGHGRVGMIVATVLAGGGAVALARRLRERRQRQRKGRRGRHRPLARWLMHR